LIRSFDFYVADGTSVTGPISGVGAASFGQRDLYEGGKSTLYNSTVAYCGIVTLATPDILVDIPFMSVASPRLKEFELGSYLRHIISLTVAARCNDTVNTVPPMPS